MWLAFITVINVAGVRRHQTDFHSAPHWILTGFSLDSHWILTGFSLDSHWILTGFSLDSHCHLHTLHCHLHTLHCHLHTLHCHLHTLHLSPLHAEPLVQLQPSHAELLVPRRLVPELVRFGVSIAERGGAGDSAKPASTRRACTIQIWRAETWTVATTESIPAHR